MRSAAVVRLAGALLCAGLLATARPAPGIPTVEGEIEAFLDAYFASWSRADMEAYRDCFLPQATIHFVQGAAVRSTPRDAFVEGQRRVHAAETAPLHEEATSKQIEVDGDLARARVTWVLQRGEDRIRGTDYFTLLRTPRGWKIVSLVFRND